MSSLPADNANNGTQQSQPTHRHLSQAPKTTTFAVAPGRDFAFVQKEKKGTIIAVGHRNPTMAEKAFKSIKNAFLVAPETNSRELSRLAVTSRKLAESARIQDAEAFKARNSILVNVEKTFKARNFASRGRVILPAYAATIVATMWFTGGREILEKLVDSRNKAQN